MDNNIENEVRKGSSFGNKGLDKVGVLISVLIGISFSLLVIKDFIGINLFLFSLLAIAGVGYMLYKDDNLDFKNYIFFAGSFLLYASIFFRLRQEVYTVLAFPTLIVMLVFTTIFSSKVGAKQGFITFLYRVFGPIARMDKIFVSLSALNSGSKNKKHFQIFLGILISAVLLFVVVPLMMSAEVAFETFAQNIIDKIKLEFDIGKFIGKTIAGLIIAIVFCGFLYTFTKDKMLGSKDNKNNIQSQDNHALIITVLSIMGVVFLVFAIVQFNALFVSARTIIEKTTFAKTAREGYFQLVALSAINFLMVLLFTSMQKGTSKNAQNIIKGLTTYFTLLNVYLLVSSAYKMTLYYDAYGLSIDRLFVYILLVFEFIALALLLIKIYKSNMPFIKMMIYYSVAFWAIVSLVNIDAWVADVNINRYEETGKIDMDYVYCLSDDASTQIKELYFDNYDKLSYEQREKIYIYFYYNNDIFDGYWTYDSIEDFTIKQYKAIHKGDSWLEFNISKMRKYDNGLVVLEHYLGFSSTD